MKSIKAVSIILIPMLLTMATLPLANIAYASPPTTVNWVWTITATEFTLLRLADGNMIFSVDVTDELVGDLTGTLVFEDTIWVIKPTGEIKGAGFGTFTGTVNGASGTLLWRLEGKGVGNFISGPMVILSGTGGLANLHGEGTWSGISGVGGTGSGQAQVHFDP